MIVSVKEKFDRRRSGRRDGVTTHTRAFLVICDDINDGTAAAITAVDPNTGIAIPVEGADHPKLDGSIVTSIDADVVPNSSTVFEVTTEYSSETDAIDQAENPLQRAPEFDWSGTEESEAYFKDTDDKPMVNSAGQQFDQLPERESSRLTITMTRNEAEFDAAAADQFSNTVNSGSVTIGGTTFAAGTLKMSPIKATGPHVENDVTFYTVVYTWKANRKGWRDKRYDIGFDELVDVPDQGEAVKQIRPILDRTSNPIKKPWPLDGQGKKKTNPNDTPEEIEFKPYEEVSWSGFGIG